MEQELVNEFETRVKPFLYTYCLDCHNATKAKGDLNLAQYLTGRSAVSLATVVMWKEAAGRVHANDMPPAAHEGKELKQPSDAERAQFISWGAQHQIPLAQGSGTRNHPPPVAGGVRQHLA
jgi:hypothetical protein